MKSLLRMPRINNPTNNRIARTTGIRQQRQYSVSYPHRTSRLPRPRYYRNVPVPVLIVLTLNKINLHEIIKKGNIPYSNAQNVTLIRKTPAYPTKRINKKRKYAKDADAEAKVRVISAIE